jgi:hypothetical protein
MFRTTVHTEHTEKDRCANSISSVFFPCFPWFPLRQKVARCEQGYLCEVCGKDVGEITDSDLYLRYVLGEVPPEQLHLLPERHICCNPSLAQYIVDPAFPPVACDGLFAKGTLDPGFVAREETRVTRGWRRLQELTTLGIPIIEYPLPEVRQRLTEGQDVPS